MACSTVSCLAMLKNMTLNTKSFENPVFSESKWPSGALLKPFLLAEVPQTSFLTIQNEGAIFAGRREERMGSALEKLLTPSGTANMAF